MHFLNDHSSKLALDYGSGFLGGWVFDTEIELRLNLVESLALAVEAGELLSPRQLAARVPSDRGFVAHLSCVMQEQLFPQLLFLDDNLLLQLNQENSTLSQKFPQVPVFTQRP